MKLNKLFVSGVAMAGSLGACGSDSGSQVGRGESCVVVSSNEGYEIKGGGDWDYAEWYDNEGSIIENAPLEYQFNPDKTVKIADVVGTITTQTALGQGVEVGSAQVYSPLGNLVDICPLER